MLNKSKNYRTQTTLTLLLQLLFLALTLKWLLSCKKIGPLLFLALTWMFDSWSIESAAKCVPIIFKVQTDRSYEQKYKTKCSNDKIKIED